MTRNQDRTFLFQLARRKSPMGQRGFTLIELMIVMTIILILIGIAAGNYQRPVVRARGAPLKTELQGMRQALANFTHGKEAAAPSLRDQLAHRCPVDPQ